MGSGYRSEVLAVQKLRAKYPQMSQTLLAKRIIATRNGTNNGTARAFLEADDVATAKATSHRPYYSLYSTIRRYDTASRTAKKAA